MKWLRNYLFLEYFVLKLKIGFHQVVLGNFIVTKFLIENIWKWGNLLAKRFYNSYLHNKQVVLYKLQLKEISNILHFFICQPSRLLKTCNTIKNCRSWHYKQAIVGIVQRNCIAYTILNMWIVRANSLSGEKKLGYLRYEPSFFLPL